MGFIFPVLVALALLVGMWMMLRRRGGGSDLSRHERSVSHRDPGDEWRSSNYQG
jgi:hypothetical protein